MLVSGSLSTSTAIFLGKILDLPVKQVGDNSNRRKMSRWGISTFRLGLQKWGRLGVGVLVTPTRECHLVNKPVPRRANSVRC